MPRDEEPAQKYVLFSWMVLPVMQLPDQLFVAYPYQPVELTYNVLA